MLHYLAPSYLKFPPFFRYRVTDVIGTANDIGVENLSAAGLIAGETARAYNDIVTMSMATSR